MTFSTDRASSQYLGFAFQATAARHSMSFPTVEEKSRGVTPRDLIRLIDERRIGTDAAIAETQERRGHSHWNELIPSSRKNNTRHDIRFAL